MTLLSDIISWTAFFLLVMAYWNLVALAAPKVNEWMSKQRWVYWFADRLP